MNNLNQILSKVVENDYRLTVDDAALLFDCNNKSELLAIKNAADLLRQKLQVTELVIFAI